MTLDKKNAPERKKVRIAGFFTEQEAKIKSPRTKTPRDSPELKQTLRTSTPYKTQEEVMRDYEKVCFFLFICFSKNFLRKKVKKLLEANYSSLQRKKQQPI